MRSGDDVADRTVLPAPGVTTLELPDGRVAVVRPRAGPIGTALLRALRMSPDLRVYLDGVGADAWRLLDGRDTAAVLRALARLHPDETNLGERLGRHLGNLVANRLAIIRDP